MALLQLERTDPGLSNKTSFQKKRGNYIQEWSKKGKQKFLFIINVPYNVK